jgi:hypothetical protein
VIIAEPGEYQAKAPVDEIGQRTPPTPCSPDALRFNSLSYPEIRQRFSAISRSCFMAVFKTARSSLYDLAATAAPGRLGRRSRREGQTEGSRAERRWQRLHVPAVHQRSPWHWKESERRTWAQSGPNARDWPSRNACLRSGGCYIHARWRHTDRSRRSGGQGVASSNVASPTKHSTGHLKALCPVTEKAW